MINSRYTASPIHFEVASELTPPADLTAIFRFADEKAVVGHPGKQAGDLMLVEKPEGGYQVIVSLGKPERCSAEIVRRAGGALGKWLLTAGCAHLDVDIDSLQKTNVPDAPAVPLEALLEGIRLGAYRFARYKQAEDAAAAAADVRVTLRCGEGPERNQVSIDRVNSLTSAVLFARGVAHEPANVINPITLAELAAEIAAQTGLTVKTLDEKDLAELGAGAMLAVGQGSQTPPRLIVLEYAGQTQDAPIALVGKALTFDSGGYSLKSTEGIVGMKYDKCGGVDVLAVMAAAAEMGVRTPLVGIIGAVENMVSEAAYRPDDILTSLSGKTIEVISTDAEGRLVLADALTYAQQIYHPRAIIDLATLTGGVVTALGRVRAGLMSNNDDLSAALFAAGEKTGELLWRLPLDEEYAKNVKGDDADLKNSGGREGHAILGGAFLQQFVDPAVPWAHLDIAGVADLPKDAPYSPKGATGFGVRLLFEYLLSL